MTNTFYTTYFATKDGLAHACDPAEFFDDAVDAYVEARDDGYPSEVFLIDLDKGTAIKHTDRANRRVINRSYHRGQELPEWLA